MDRAGGPLGRATDCSPQGCCGEHVRRRSSLSTRATADPRHLLSQSGSRPRRPRNFENAASPLDRGVMTAFDTSYRLMAVSAPAEIRPPWGVRAVRGQSCLAGPRLLADRSGLVIASASKRISRSRLDRAFRARTTMVLRASVWSAEVAGAEGEAAGLRCLAVGPRLPRRGGRGRAGDPQRPRPRGPARLTARPRLARSPRRPVAIGPRPAASRWSGLADLAWSRLRGGDAGADEADGVRPLLFRGMRSRADPDAGRPTTFPAGRAGCLMRCRRRRPAWRRPQRRSAGAVRVTSGGASHRPGILEA